jgi:hypothetical protein
MHRRITHFVLRLAAIMFLAGSPVFAQQVDDDAALQNHLLAIFQSGEAERDAAIDYLVERGNIDAAATLITAHRFVYDADEKLDAALVALTGHQAAGWFEWMLWQEAHPEIQAHKGYERLRRVLFISIDPRFDSFFDGNKTHPGNMRIRLEEIVWGGVPALDGIPSLDNPDLIDAADAEYLRPDDLVFGVSINGDARAYPLRIMGWHEMFNDVIGGQPVALAYCTLCGSGILYDTSVEGQNEPFVLGSSGLLYRSNKLMYDQQTKSLWNQFTGEPVTGELAHSGIRLKTLPVAITTWQDWRAANPGTRVLALETGHRRDYSSGNVYRDYFASPDLMFPALVRAGQTPRQKDYVFGMRGTGVSRAWPLTAFTDMPVINDQFGGDPVVLVGDPKARTVRAYMSGEQAFSEDPAGLTDGTTVWQVTEAALVAPDGRTLDRLPGHIAYWFAWDGYLGDLATLYGRD